MSYEIEIDVGNRTYHYGSVAAFRKDGEERSFRIARLSVLRLKDSITPARKAKLTALLEKEKQEFDAIRAATVNLNRKLYA